MIQAKELRLGNYVVDAHDREDETAYMVSRLETPDYTKWNSGDDFNVTCLNPNNGSYYDIVPSPIPLTEQWLIDFGLRHDRGFFYNEEKTFRLSESTTVKGVWFLELGYDAPSRNRWIGIKTVQYVHDFQNTIFAVSDEELTLNK